LKILLFSLEENIYFINGDPLFMGFLDDFEKSVTKTRKRQTLGVNIFRGQMSENVFEAQQRMMGNDVTRTGRGHDFKITHRHPFTGEYEGTTYHEVKTGNSKLSPLQKATKKKMGSRYKEERSGW
jgi:hypothetical protein